METSRVNASTSSEAPAIVPAIVTAGVPDDMPAVVPFAVPAIVTTGLPGITPAGVPSIVPGVVPAGVPTVVDGAMLEGGGQILRVAAALAAITGKAVTIKAIRAGRTKPGLAAQHFAGLDLVRRMCHGDWVVNDDRPVGVGSTHITLVPDKSGAYLGGVPNAAKKQKQWRAEVGTAGACP